MTRWFTDASTVWYLGLKEFRSLAGDPMLLFLIVFMFTVAVYSDARAKPETLSNASIAVVDEDQSPLSQAIIAALHPPQFMVPKPVSLAEMDRGMDTGQYTFVVDIPPNFQRDILAKRQPSIQLNVDATRQGQAQSGAGYIQHIIADEVRAYEQQFRAPAEQPVNIVMRALYNPNLTAAWFAAVTSVIDHITMLGILLTGAALIREREHGTIEHLLVMPITPLQIMLSKIWSMGVVVLIVATLSLWLVVETALQVTVSGSLALFAVGTLLYLFAASSMGIYMGALVKNMPQFGLLAIMILLPLQILSGSLTPRESMPEWIRQLMSLAPTTHYVAMAQSILFRGAGWSLVWPQFTMILLIGILFFYMAWRRLRNAINRMQR